jgi:hypothetical protein
LSALAAKGHLPFHTLCETRKFTQVKPSAW